MKQLILALLVTSILSACQAMPDSSGLASPLPTLLHPTEDVTPTSSISLMVTPTATWSGELDELLLVWGKQRAFDGDCRLLILHPTPQQQLEFTNQGQDCNYQVVTLNRKQYLTSYPSFLPIDDRPYMELALYNLTAEGKLEVQQKFVLNNIRITQPPQWSENGFIYLSGIRNGREQIYLFDRQTETLAPYIDASDGFSTLPSLSPNHRYLAYQVVANHESQDECGGLTCFEIFYHIWDTETKMDIALLPLIELFIWGEPNFMHCDLAWSPTGHFIAFDVGCGVQTPASIIIFDVVNQQLVEVINSQEGLARSSWVSEDEIIIRGKMSFALSGGADEGYVIYSANNQDWHRLTAIPERNRYEYDAIYINDWTSRGAVAVGQTQAPGENEKRVVDLVILDIEDDNETTLYVRTPDENVVNPIWSPGDDLIAYRSYNWDTRNERSRFTIINRSGETILDTGMIDIFSPDFGWFLYKP
jgi:hypothetical protein